MDHLFAYSENSIIGLIILVVIFMNMKFTHKRITLDEKLFMIIVLSTSVIIVLDILMDILSGTSGFLLRELHIGLTMLYFILNPIPFMAWTLYVHFYFYKSDRKIKKLLPLIAIPAVISTVLSLMSLINGGVFYIDMNNIYQRGYLFWFNGLFYYSYFVITFILIITKLRRVKKKECLSLITFAVLPAIAGIIQSSTTSQSFIWLGVALSSLIIFITIQNNAIKKDYLTGLYNRRELDRYLTHSINELRVNESLLMLMVDLNHFKSINDKFGHLEGDQALKHTANILLDCFRTEDFISRYAGDEFVIIVKLDDEQQKYIPIERLQTGFNEFNSKSQLPYELNISIGHAIYDENSECSTEDLLRIIDKRMYEDKKE